MDIVNFLPKYPNITPYENTLLNPYSVDFYDSIYMKKEFYDERLEAQEDINPDPGNLMKHQKIIARFFSSYTPYNHLLLVHAMGTGKTCSAIGAVEHIKNYGDGFKGVLYLAKGDALINNFMNELIFKCTDGRYIPEDYSSLTNLEKIHRRKKAIQSYYKFNTFETFAKKIKGWNDDYIRTNYKNYIIIIDEVHNLRIQSKITGLNVYDQFNRFLHVISDCKVLLMSGTPMKDNVDEIASVMNLILSPDEALPTGDIFISDFFTQQGDVYTPKPTAISILKQKFKGRVSYLQAMESNVEKVFMGEHLGKLNHLMVVSDIMSNFQTLSYKKAFILDTETAKKGVYSNSRQASLFVYPDGTYGKDGFNTYITRSSKKGITVMGDDGRKQTLTSFSLKPALRMALIGDDSINKLTKFSAIYGASIRNILRAQEEGKCVFVYNEFVEGSGLILFGLLLEIWGFTKATGNEQKGNNKPRYASLTNLTSSTSQIRDLVARFNQPDNINGRVIQILVGSRKISEGFSFQNIQVEEIQTPWFNYSETSQAIARGYRLGSHRMLIEAGLERPQLQIYQRVSLPDPKVMPMEDSIDLRMYEISEKKDISIKAVERIIKESAFDCTLNYARNNRTSSIDGERDCEYMSCRYTCEGVHPDETLTKNQLDYSTYQLYYTQTAIEDIISTVKDIFLTIFSIDLYTLSNNFDKYTQFDIITSLRKMINENIIITNKYGLPSYLKEEYNIYFLVDNLSVNGTFSSEYYTKYPHIKSNKTFKELLNPIYIESLPNIVSRICKATTMDTIRINMTKLPLSLNETFLESSLLAKKLEITTNIPVRELLISYFNKSYDIINGAIVSWLLLDNDGILRCLPPEGNEWINCPPEYKNLIIKRQEENKQKMEGNIYGIYGQYNPETNNFCIRDVRQDIPDKKHQRTAGKVCINWNAEDLYNFAIRVLNIPIPPRDILIKYFSVLKQKKRDIKQINDLSNRDQLWDVIQTLKIVKNMFTKDELTAEDMIRVIYWGSMQKKIICPLIQSFFEKEGLLDTDTGCGKVDKKKI
jgi:hypothetical protein